LPFLFFIPIRNLRLFSFLMQVCIHLFEW
jgi:hypothetical protein